MIERAAMERWERQRWKFLLQRWAAGALLLGLVWLVVGLFKLVAWLVR